MTPGILIVAPSAYTYGGLASWLDYLVPGLRQRGWRVTLGLVEGAVFHRPDRYVASHPDPHWTSIPCRSGTPEGRCRAVVRAIVSDRPDVVVAVNIPDVYCAVARLRRAGHPVRATMALHNIEPEFYGDMRRWAALLDGVICPNRLACALAERLGGVASQRINYAPCGTASVPDGGTPRRGDRLRIAYVGRLEEARKRLGDIPVILRQLEADGVPFEMRIAGTGAEEAALRRELTDFEKAKRVRFLGRLDSEVIRREVYADADLLLLTSLWETGPLVIWEAMSAGLAVVSSRYVGSGLEGSLRQDETALLFPVGDTRAAAAQLARLWREPGLRERIGGNGRALVAARYTVAASLEAWDAALRRIMEAGRLPPPAESGRAFAGTVGRLDRWLGRALAESVRGVLGRRGPAADAGGEWPHSYGIAQESADEFWRAARTLDAGPPME